MTPIPSPNPPFIRLLVYNYTKYLNRKISNKENRRITSGLIPCSLSNASFISVKYRILSYLRCGLSAERSYIQRKTHIIIFFSSTWTWRHTIFFIKLINHKSSTKYINYKNNSVKKFLNTQRFKIERSATEKWGDMYFELSRERQAPITLYERLV